MKKILLMAASCLVLFTACNKDNGSEPTDETSAQKYPVAFKVSGFTAVQTPIESKTISGVVNAKATNSLVDLTQDPPLTKIIYAVFNSKGEMVSRLQQFKDQAGAIYRIKDDKEIKLSDHGQYGELKDTLQVGTYTVVVACGQYINFNTAMYSSSPQYVTKSLDDAVIYNGFGVPGDMTYYKGTFTVGTSSVERNIELKRVVSQLVLNFENGMPKDAKQMSLSVYAGQSVLRIKDNSFEDSQPIFMVVGHTDPPNTPNSGYLMYVMGAGVALELEYGFEDATGNTFYSRRIKDVPITVNKRTTLSGKAVEETGGSFVIQPNQAWGTGIDVKF